MRLWSLHPRHLDRQGLTACWRESLLAQAVLAGRTRGYTRHPQHERFREHPDALELIGAYLTGVADEAAARGYRFDRGRILHETPPTPRMTVTEGQLQHEWRHLLAKLERRSPDLAGRWRGSEPQPHPLFRVVPGPVAAWERVMAAATDAAADTTAVAGAAAAATDAAAAADAAAVTDAAATTDAAAATKTKGWI
jgi:hypothetical protein